MDARPLTWFERRIEDMKVACAIVNALISGYVLFLMLFAKNGHSFTVGNIGVVILIVFIALLLYTAKRLHNASKALKKTNVVWIICSVCISISYMIATYGLAASDRELMADATADAFYGINVCLMLVFVALSFMFLIKKKMYLEKKEIFCYLFAVLEITLLTMYPIQCGTTTFTSLSTAEKCSVGLTCAIVVIPMMLNLKHHLCKFTEDDDYAYEEAEEEKTTKTWSDKRPPVTKEYINQLRTNIESIRDDLIRRGYTDKRDPDLFNEIGSALWEAEYAMMSENEEDGLCDAYTALDRELNNLTGQATVIRAKLREEEIAKEKAQKEREEKTASSNTGANYDLNAILNANTTNPRWGTIEMNAAVENAAKFYGINLATFKTKPAAEREQIIKRHRGLLAKLYHPDEAGGGNATQAIAVNKAYEILIKYVSTCMA